MQAECATLDNQDDDIWHFITKPWTKKGTRRVCAVSVLTLAASPILSHFLGIGTAAATAKTILGLTALAGGMAIAGIVAAFLIWAYFIHKKIEQGNYSMAIFMAILCVGVAAALLFSSGPVGWVFFVVLTMAAALSLLIPEDPAAAFSFLLPENPHSDSKNTASDSVKGEPITSFLCLISFMSMSGISITFSLCTSWITTATAGFTLLAGTALAFGIVAALFLCAHFMYQKIKQESYKEAAAFGAACFVTVILFLSVSGPVGWILLGVLAIVALLNLLHSLANDIFAAARTDTAARANVQAEAAGSVVVSSSAMGAATIPPFYGAVESDRSPLEVQQGKRT